MKTYMSKLAELDRKWKLVDATDQTLGRLATRIAKVLIGKNKPTYTPHLDGGDFVVVVNCKHVKLTGTKMEKKTYEWVTHSPSGQSSMPGGHRSRSVRDQLERDATVVITKAVSRMMPKTKLGRQQLTKLRCFAGAEHTHKAQKPETLDLAKI